MVKVCMLVTNTVEKDARVVREAKSLSNSGYDIVILGTTDKKSGSKKKLDDITIKLIYKKHGQNSLLGKIELFRKFSKEAKKENGDIYHAHDLSTLLESYIASKKNKSKLIYDSHELYVIGKKSKSMGMMYYKFLERFLINKPDLIITVNEFIAKLLKEHYTLERTPEVIMNLPDKRYYDKTKTHEPHYRKQDNTKKIVYQGIMRKERGLLNLIKCFEYLDDSYRLMLIGYGSYMDILKDYVKTHGLEPRVEFLGFVEYDNLINVTKQADVGVICGTKSKLSYYYAAPNKLFEYFHAGLPVITNDYPFYQKVVGENHLGLFWKTKEPEDMAKVIKQMFEDHRSYDEFKQNVLKIKDRYKWENEEIRLVELYKELSRDIDG